MKKIKLNFTDTHNHLATFFYNILSTRYDIDISEKPDFLIFGDENFGINNRNISKNDVIKIFYTGENRRPENYDCHYAISFDNNNSSWHYRLPLFIIYMWALEKIHKTKYNYDYILNTPLEKKEKTDFCSFVVSNPGCQERNEFFTKLNAIKRVDSGGRFMKNISYDLPDEQSKIDFLSTRKFNICFEPSSHPGYTTEKILHAFYAQTVPIYWGSSTVHEDFNPKSFINVMDYKSFDDVIEHVMFLDQNEAAYNEILEQPKFNNNIPPDYYNLENFLDWFDSVVYNKRDYR